MPYAANGIINKDTPIDGGIEITEAQYADALDQIVAGKQVRVSDGQLDFVEPPPGGTTYWVAPREEHQTAPGEEVPADATTTPPPTDYHVLDAGQWVEDADLRHDWFAAEIVRRADGALAGGVAVTASDGQTYSIRTGPAALALIDGAAVRADRALRNGTAVTRLVPTDQGVVEFGADDLWAVFEATETHQQTVADRQRTLEGKLADGSITEADLDEGWP